MAGYFSQLQRKLPFSCFMRSIGLIAMARFCTVISPCLGEVYGAEATWSGLALLAVRYAAALIGLFIIVSDIAELVVGDVELVCY